MFNLSFRGSVNTGSVKHEPVNVANHQRELARSAYGCMVKNLICTVQCKPHGHTLRLCSAYWVQSSTKGIAAGLFPTSPLAEAACMGEVKLSCNSGLHASVHADTVKSVEGIRDACQQCASCGCT